MSEKTDSPAPAPLTAEEREQGFDSRISWVRAQRDVAESRLAATRAERDELRATVQRLEAERERDKADRDRLDWVETNQACIGHQRWSNRWYSRAGRAFRTAREAIDAARAALSSTPSQPGEEP